MIDDLCCFATVIVVRVQKKSVFEKVTFQGQKRKYEWQGHSIADARAAFQWI